MSKTWLITGCSSGLGLAISIAALKAGDRVIATSRDPNKTPEAVSQVEKLGGAWKALDVAADDVEEKLKEIVSLDEVDVFVSNAGVSTAATVEDISVQEMNEIMAVNFFGPFRVIRTLLPHLRTKRSGTIVQISSGETLQPHPGLGSYAAAKSAMDTLLQSLRGEVASFGIRIITVLPGGLKGTNFVSNARRVPLSEGYKGSPVDLVFQYLEHNTEWMKVDVARMTDRIVQAVQGKGIAAEVELDAPGGFILPIGSEIGEGLSTRSKEYKDLARTWEPVWRSTDIS